MVKHTIVDIHFYIFIVKLIKSWKISERDLYLFHVSKPILKIFSKQLKNIFAMRTNKNNKWGCLLLA